MGRKGGAGEGYRETLKPCLSVVWAVVVTRYGTCIQLIMIVVCFTMMGTGGGRGQVFRTRDRLPSREAKRDRPRQ